MTKTELQSHAFECIINRDKWQAELNATLQEIQKLQESEVKINK